MWLLDTTTLQLTNFLSHDPPKYAILSHTWGAPDEEVLFEDTQCGVVSMQAKSSFIKLQYTCDQARKEKLKYCWIDTCCIDKRSSSELQEAINSMYQWYQRAEICYVYLSDVLNPVGGSEMDSEFYRSKWFTRGWTLQELIAPSRIRFYTRDWKLIGSETSLTGSETSLTSAITHITKIPSDVLTGDTALQSSCVSQRMSWAAGRRTSRPEDIAYCLMGIFSVNMPMIYGEGNNAFRRLQEEIIKSTQDHSIFVWRYPDTETSECVVSGLLADSPDYFSNSPAVRFLINQSHDSPPFSMTNRGLEFNAHLIQLGSRPEVYAMVLNCRPTKESGSPEVLVDGALAIMLESDTYARVNPCQLLYVQHFPFSTKTIYAEPMGKWPDYEDEYFPRKPWRYRYTVASKSFIESLHPPEYINKASTEATPRYVDSSIISL
jgi:hypothetical protein